MAEYLLAAHALKDKPTTEDFMLLADGNDLNPHDDHSLPGVFGAEPQRPRSGVGDLARAGGDCPTIEFAAEAAGVVERLHRREPAPDQPINPLVAGAFLGKPLKDLADAAQIYGELLARRRQALASRDRASRGGKRSRRRRRLPDANLEALRQVLYGPEAPAGRGPQRDRRAGAAADRAVAEQSQQAAQGDRRLARQRPGRAAAGDGAGRSAATPSTPRVFVRGNPNNLGDEVPRRFLRVLSDGEPPAVQRTAAGGWNWPGPLSTATIR